MADWMSAASHKDVRIPWSLTRAKRRDSMVGGFRFLGAFTAFFLWTVVIVWLERLWLPRRTEFSAGMACFRWGWGPWGFPAAPQDGILALA